MFIHKYVCIVYVCEYPCKGYIPLVGGEENESLRQLNAFFMVTKSDNNSTTTNNQASFFTK